jgi:hypothetical protein
MAFLGWFGLNLVKKCRQSAGKIYVLPFSKSGRKAEIKGSNGMYYHLNCMQFIS